MKNVRRIGKREREARKRHRRTLVYSSYSGWQPLKLGHKKMLIHVGRMFASTGGRCRKSNADTRTREPL